MPSQICHILLAEDAAARAFPGDPWIDAESPLYLFGAQGPDFFYHNGRTRPSGRTFGSVLHRRSYGKVVRHLTGCLRTLSPEDRALLRSFIAGFVTHAPLDRLGHPYIDYFSGWEERGRPETARYRRCHAYLERILDVALLRQIRGKQVAEFPVAERMDCGSSLPAAVVETIAGALRLLLPDWRMVADAEVRIANAYSDAMGFYRYTGDPRFRKDAIREDQQGPHRRRLALFHPEQIPVGFDFLNDQNRRWLHPVTGAVSHESFGQLYARALKRSVLLLLELREAESTGDLDQLEIAVGNKSLGTASNPTTARIHCAPLPLYELLDGQYPAAGVDLTL